MRSLSMKPVVMACLLSVAAPAPSVDLPLSEFLGAQTRAALERQAVARAERQKACPTGPFNATRREEIVAVRQCWDEHYYRAIVLRHRERYPVTIQPTSIGGVKSEIIAPSGGVSVANKKRVLINLHGGGFVMGGGGPTGQIESIPIAALGKIKVISVDYRMAPEYRFPAGSDDAVAVYRALLQDYKPENIGIYGCSAGGMLTAQTTAALQKRGLPAPGAVGLFCSGAGNFNQGDSANISQILTGARPTVAPLLRYMTDEDSTNPLAYPGLSAELMAKFPSTLLITSTRDRVMSSVVATHAQLVQLGVKADLHVWEGLDHAFLYEPDFSESREAYGVIVRFFADHLGNRGRSR